MFTIQQVIIETLLEHKVTKIDNKNIKVGYTYDEVLEIVHSKVKKNPLLQECSTTKNCITWYASKMRNESTKHYNKDILEIFRPKKSSKKTTK